MKTMRTKLSRTISCVLVVMAASATILALPGVQAAYATAGASAYCSYNGPVLGYHAGGSANGYAAGTLLDFGAIYEANAQADLMPSVSDAGAWPVKNYASASVTAPDRPAAALERIEASASGHVTFAVLGVGLPGPPINAVGKGMAECKIQSVNPGNLLVAISCEGVQQFAIAPATLTQQGNLYFSSLGDSDGNHAFFVVGSTMIRGINSLDLNDGALALALPSDASVIGSISVIRSPSLCAFVQSTSQVT